MSASAIVAAASAQDTVAVITAFSHSIGPPLGFIIIATGFATTLIPILLALCYFSTSQSRRRPIFILNVVSILLGIGLAVWSDYVEANAILRPFNSISVTEYASFGVIFGFAPWLSELVLAIRLLAVFPPNRTSRLTLISVFTFPVIAKVGRLVVLVLYYQKFIQELQHIGIAYEAAQSVNYRHLVYLKIEWFMEIFDNMYCSVLFICKLTEGWSIFRSLKDIHIFTLNYSFRRRVRTLFWIAIQNFVLPVALNIVILLDLYLDPDYSANTTYLLFANYYVTIIGVVFATVWSSSYPFKYQIYDLEMSPPWKEASRQATFSIATPADTELQGASILAERSQRKHPLEEVDPHASYVH